MTVGASVLVIGAEEEECVVQIRHILEALGVSVETAEDCLTAMAAVKSEKIDLAILGEHGGNFNPVETARVLKSLHRHHYLPVLLVSPKAPSARQRLTLRENDIDDVLGPPFDQETIRHRVHALLRLKSAYDQLGQVRLELEKTLARENALLKQLREDNRDGVAENGVQDQPALRPSTFDAHCRY